MIEVEVKAKVNDFNPIYKTLKKLNTTKIKTETQEDTYFNAPHRDFKITDEALRIRKIDNDNSNIFITYKGAKMDKISKTRNEFEIKVDDAESAKNIFKNLGFKFVAIVIKNRQIYKYNEFIITLDTIENLGTFIEIEKTLKNDNSDFNKAVQDVFNIFSKIGITTGFERKSYLELLLNE